MKRRVLFWLTILEHPVPDQSEPRLLSVWKGQCIMARVWPGKAHFIAKG
jgi:hypothetical protein